MTLSSELQRDLEVIEARIARAGDVDEALTGLDTLIERLCQIRTAMDDRRSARAPQLPEHLRRDAVRLPRIYPPPGSSGRY